MANLYRWPPSLVAEILGSDTTMAEACEARDIRPASFQRWITQPQVKDLVFGDASITYRDWRDLGTPLYPGTKDEVLVRPKQARRESTSPIANHWSIQTYHIPTVCLAIDLGVPYLTVYRYTQRHRPDPALANIVRENRRRWFNQFTLDDWLDKGYPETTFNKLTAQLDGENVEEDDVDTLKRRIKKLESFLIRNGYDLDDI